MIKFLKISILTAIFAIALYSCKEETVTVSSVSIAIPPNMGSGGSGSSNTMNLSEKTTITVAVEPPNAKDKSVTVTSSNPAVVSVTETATGWELTATGVGQATITATANDGSGTTSSVTLTVVIPELTLTVTGTYTYTGAFIVPTTEVKAGGTVLTAGTHYTLACENNLNAGTATVTATGTSLYEGKSDMKTFTIQPVKTTFVLTLSETEFTYNGTAQIPEVVTVAWNDKQLTVGDEYTIEYKNNLNAGTATVTATGASLYEGKSDVKTFTIQPVKTTFVLTLSETEFTYNGVAQIPEVVTVVWNDKQLTVGEEYTIQYSNNLNAGTATVSVTGTGNFDGSSGTKNYTIARFPVSVAANDAEKNYWVSDPPLTYIATPKLIGDDVLSGMLARASGNDVGTYNITQGTLAQEGNYEITEFTPAIFTIYYFRGSGTEAEPYEIDVIQQLAGLAQFVNANNTTFNDKYYKLMADINLNVAPYNSGAGWTPIGNSNNSFKGHFNGNNHRVTGLFINGTSDNVGLFGTITGGSVRNLGVEGSSVSGRRYIGGMVGTIANGSITNCYTTVAVIASWTYVGGVAGYLGYSGGIGCSITNCYATGAVSSTSSNNADGFVGGVAGYTSGSYNHIITNCYATGAISGNSNIGGIVGSFTCNPTTGRLEYCVALNPGLTRSSGSSTNFGRVCYSGSGTVANNSAWVGMTLPSGSSGSNSRHGSDITATDALSQFSYEVMQWKFGVNDDNPWKMGVGEYKLPVFYWQTTAPSAMPAHLSEN